MEWQTFKGGSSNEETNRRFILQMFRQEWEWIHVQVFIILFGLLVLLFLWGGERRMIMLIAVPGGISISLYYMTKFLVNKRRMLKTQKEHMDLYYERERETQRKLREARVSGAFDRFRSEERKKNPWGKT